MNCSLPTDNSAGITCGGASQLYKTVRADILGISGAARGSNLVSSKDTTTAKEWKFPSECQVEDSIIEAADGSEILAKLMVRRGLRTPADVKSFLDPEAFTPSSPMDFAEMPRAVARIAQAIANKEKITVYGDYDVDGVTATAVMMTTLRKLGAEVDFYIPNRSEGYGLNLKAISVLASKHRTKLIITCDCGISNFAEINFAKSLGVETIVTDHHTMPEMLPPAVATLHPKQFAEDHQMFHLPGVGVAYKLSEALLIDFGHPEDVEKLLDYVTLGMIADMVPLTSECRYLVQVGMPKLVGSERAGIKALLAQVSDRNQGTDLVGFGLAPRINAVGRLSDANLAVRLMITEDEQEASQLARQLELENERRQELCEQIFFKADQKASAGMKAGDKAIAIYDKEWHHGVVGIVASRLVEKYHCPVFIGELDEDEGIVKGSARGIAGIDLYEVLKANEHLALKWGGHKMAAGWSVEVAKAELFCRGIVDTCNRMLGEQALRPTLEIDLEVEPDQVTPELCTLLARLAPFGMANKKPILAMKDQVCSGTRVLGKEGKHNRIMMESADGQVFESVFWNSRGRVPDEGQKIDVAFSAEMNVYNGNSRLQLVLSDWRDPSKPYVPAPVSVPQVQQAPQAVPAQAVTNAQAGMPPGSKSAEEVSPAGAQSRGPGDVRLPASEVPKKASEIEASQTINWKDLRSHAAPESLIPAAVRKLGGAVSIFAEGAPALDGIQTVDRTSLQRAQHLLMWSYPPSEEVFKQLLGKCGATNVYMVGGAKAQSEDAPTFLKRLLGLVRYAINQREGQADPEKVAAALGTSKMTIALGLTILKKINVIDWFAEDGIVYLDMIGQPTGKAEALPEFRQLANCLQEIVDFRQWCDEAALNELQLAIVPAVDGGSRNPEPTDVSDIGMSQQSSEITT